MTNAKTTDENILDVEAVKQIKKDLEARKEQIEKDLADMADKNENKNNDYKAKFPEYGDKSDENAQEISEYSTNLATEKVLEGTLKDIDAALKRIEDGSYGKCKYCGVEIGKKRMMARPVASACVECKTKLQNS
jgi:DnaK suppressor protein